MGRTITTYVIHGFHSDVVWLEDQRDYAVSLMKNVEQHLLACRFDPGFGVFLHELTYLKPYLDVNPEERDYVRGLIRQGRVATGGSHSQPSEVLVSGESILRNILYGRYYHERLLGDKPEIYMPWDVFGHISQLSQILLKSRFRGCIWSKDIFGAHAVFYHQSPDGSKLLFKRVPYWMSVTKDGRSQQVETTGDLIECVKVRSGEFRSLGLSFDLRLNCADFKPPTSYFVGETVNLKKHKTYPVVIGGAGHREWFRKTGQEIRNKSLDIPALTRDFEWHHQGTGVSRIDLKIANRIGENTVINAEKFATIANYLGAKYPDKAIDKAWRQLLFNQHHDALTGTSCDRAYLDLLQQCRESLELSSEVLENSLHYLADRVDTRHVNGITLVVFNPLNWERTDVVRVTVRLQMKDKKRFVLMNTQGKRVPFQVEDMKIEGDVLVAQMLFIAEQVPSMGYSTYYIMSADEEPVQVGPFWDKTIENEFYRITVDTEKGGDIASIFDKIAQRELLPANGEPANEIVGLEEKPDRKEPSWEVYTTGPKYFSREHSATVEVKRGPVASHIIIKGELKDCKRYQTITLYNGIKRIDFQTRLENYSGQHHLYAVTFPLNLQGLQPVFDDRFGCIVKRKSRGKFDFRVHQAKNYSECAARRAYQWVDYSSSGKIIFGDGQAITLGMVNVVTSHERDVRELAYRIGDKLIKKGIPSTPGYDDCDWERRKGLPIEDTVMPTPDNFNEDLKFGTSFRISLDASGLKLKNTYTEKIVSGGGEEHRKCLSEQLKKQGFAYLFCHDKEVPEGWEPLPVLIISATDGLHLEEAVENLFKDFEQSAAIHLPAECNASTMPLRVDDYGVAVINEGHALNSVECDGTMMLFLMHTAAWGGTPWGKDRLPFFFVPEHKTHNFFYALYPHSGTWREAKTYRSGYEFNNPLLAVETNSHRGVLKLSGSFLEINGDSLVLTALKPFENRTAGLQSDDVDVNRGIVVRFYEAEGKSTGATVKFTGKLKKVHSVNLIDEITGRIKNKENQFAVSVKPFSIESFCLIPEPWKRRGPAKSLGREREPAEVVHFRHWQHNQGEAPVGNSAVGISLQGQVQEKIHINQGGVTLARIQVGVVNNYVDRAIKGKVTFEVSEGWRMIPETVDFAIEPKAQLVKPILVSFGPWRGSRKGIIKARLEHDGQIIQDILEVGGESLLTWNVGRDASDIWAEIENPNADTIEGEVGVITTIEGWLKKEIGRYSLFEVAPRSAWFQVCALSKKRIQFEIRSDDREFINSPAAYWIVAKLVYNGKVSYLPIAGTSIGY
jgi:alpha-mannosidase